LGDPGDAQEAEAKKKQRETEEAKAEAASREKEAQAREQMELLRQAQKKVYEKVRRLPPVENRLWNPRRTPISSATKAAATKAARLCRASRCIDGALTWGLKRSGG